MHVIWVVWCGYLSTPHWAMNHNYFFHDLVGGEIANLSIFAYMAAILNSNMSGVWRYLSLPPMSGSFGNVCRICVTMSLGRLLHFNAFEGNE